MNVFVFRRRVRTPCMCSQAFFVFTLQKQTEKKETSEVLMLLEEF